MSEALPNPPTQSPDEPRRPAKRAPLIVYAVVGVLSAAAVAAWFLGPWRGGSPAGPTAAAGPPPEALVVDGVELAPRPVDVTVPAVGTLAANEAVPIASELQRRVVKVLAVDGARVKKGELLFKLDDADLGAQARQLQVRRKLLVDSEARQKRLLEDGLSSVADYERAKTDLELVDAELASLAVTIDRTSIRAPFAGRLGLRNVSEGALVSPATTLVTLHDDTKVKIDFELPERYMAFVEPGRPFTFRVAGSSEPREATVTAIEPAVDPTSRSIRVRGLTDNEGGALMSGSFVSIDFPLKSEAAGLMVPTIAVIPSMGGHSVWVAREGKATLVAVELGIRTDAEVEVRPAKGGEGGIAPGDIVLTSNLLRLRPGAAIEVGKVSK